MAVKLDPTVSLGAIIQTGLQLTMVGIGALTFFFTLSADIARLSREVQAVNERVVTKTSDLTQAISSLNEILRPFARTLERIDQMDRRIAATEARNDAQEERLGRLGESVIELRATIEPLVRASQQTLPGAPGIRAR